MNERFFDLGALAANNEFDADAEDALLVAYFGAVTPRRRARLALMKIMSDFREAMWGVVQQAISTLDVDYVDYVDTHFDRLLLRNASRPDYRQLLVDAATTGVTATRTCRPSPGRDRRRRRRGREHRVASRRARLHRRGGDRARRSDEREHVPLGRTRRPAPFEPAADADDDAQRRRVPPARGRGRRTRAARRVGARSVRCASRRPSARMEELRRQHGWAKTFGLPMELVIGGRSRTSGSR